jgi:Ca-activated chloride channel family protein
MTFAEPLALFALLLLPLIAFIMWRGDRAASKRLAEIVSPRLLGGLTNSALPFFRLIRRFLLLFAIACFMLALARPQWGFSELSVTHRGRDILLAVDTSKSMLANDVVPNRLTRAKLAAEDLTHAMPGDRFGLIAFAGEAQVEAPLTLDSPTVLEALAKLNTNTVERGGTDFAAAIRGAEQALGKQPGAYKAVVLFTDGEELDEDGLAAAKDAAKFGIRIFTVGVGSSEGSTIPSESGPPLRDRNGEIVRSKLDEQFLTQLAGVTGGFYSRLSPTTIPRLVSDGLRKLSEGNIDERSFRKPVERYQWPLSIGLLCLFLSAIVSERGKKASVSRAALSATSALLVYISSSTTSAQAASGLDLYNRGDFEGALNSFQEQLQRDPKSPVTNFNAGDAAYRLDKYDEAFEAYAKTLESRDPNLRQKAYYNAGNALFKEGDGQDELERRLTNYYDARYLYRQSLNINPQDEPTKKNLALLEERIKQTEAERDQQRKQQLRQNRSRSGRRKRKQPNQNGQSQPGQEQQDQMSPGGSDEDQDQSGDSDDTDQSGDQGQQDTQPGPTPDKKKGDLRELDPSDKSQDQKSNQAPQPGEGMTRDEALGLLDSLRNEEDHVDLTHRKRDHGVLRDW